MAICLTDWEYGFMKVMLCFRDFEEGREILKGEMNNYR